MRKIILLSFSISFLFSIDGKIVFYDGTTIDGQINSVNMSSIYITPIGLNFPEEILIDNVDSLKLDNGKLLVAGNQVLLLYSNGQFTTPGEKNPSNQQEVSYPVEYVLVPNWSLNLYTGYPIIKGASFDYYDDINPVFGLSIGSPYGLFMGNFFVNAIAEIAYYNFNVINNPDYERFGGMAWQIGVSPGFFIGEYSISLTACTGIYHAGTGFIAGGSIDLPLGSIILNKYGDVEFVENMEEVIEALEIRVTGRANTVKKNDGGTTYWLGGGISLGYEF
ncbi:uncharacterized protein METZ01_LOCUS47223 [marine metagenome]|uniref:Uncharacterized protein n=1 Tax=marine metagenome TaxID=408172 RepID=A0A381RTG3_9ZZZZ